jgi:hypothetical protein
MSILKDIGRKLCRNLQTKEPVNLPKFKETVEAMFNLVFQPGNAVPVDENTWNLVSRISFYLAY